MRATALLLLLAGMCCLAASPDVAAPVVEKKPTPAIILVFASLSPAGLTPVNFVCMWYLRHFHPSSPIHLIQITSSERQLFSLPWTPSADQQALLDSLAVQHTAVSDDATPGLQRFVRNYRHSSGNDLAYERFCAMRFSVLEHAFDLFKLDSAAFFDLDVATFTNMFDALAPLVNSREYWTFGSWMSFYTRPLLHSFAAFVADTFEGDGERVARQFVARGTTIPPGTPLHARLTALTAAWWPASVPQRVELTDMEMHVAWAAHNSVDLMWCSRRARVSPLPQCHTTRGKPILDGALLYSVPSINAELGYTCDSADVGRDRSARMAAHNFTFDRGLPALFGVPVMSIHYNGLCKRYICMPALCRRVTSWAGGNASLLAPMGGCCGGTSDMA